MPASLSSPRFVGREHELGQIAVALERARLGSRSSVLVAGTGGLGASRLLSETERRLADLPEPYLVLRGQAYAPRSGDPYDAVASALRRGLEGLADEQVPDVVGPFAEVLVRLLPSQRARFDALGLLPERPLVVATERRQTRMLEAIVGVLRRLGQDRLVVLMLEDLQHADAGTRALAGLLGRTVGPERLCTLATYQPDALTRDHPLRSTLTAIADGARPVEQLELQPLDRDELAELLEALEGERPSAAALLLVTERSRGNPLVAEEFIAARRELSSAALAGSLGRLVAARLTRRSAACRQVLEILAVAAEPLTVDELRIVAAGQAAAPAAVRRPPVAPRPPSLQQELAGGIAEALESGFVVRGTAARPGAEERPLALRHELIGAAIVADLVPGLRQRHHVALAALRRSRPSVAAQHLLAAHELAAARAAATEAGALADAADSGGDALALYDLALELGDVSIVRDGSPARVDGAEDGGLPGAVMSPPQPGPGPGPAPRGPASPASVGSAAVVAAPALTAPAPGMTAAGITAPPIAAAARPGSASPAELEQAELLARAADAAFAAGEPQRAVSLGEAAIAIEERQRNRLRLGLLWERLGHYRRLVGDHDGAVAAHRRAVDLIPTEPSRERARALATLAQIRMIEGIFSEAERLARQAAGVAEEVGEPAVAELVHARCTQAVVQAWGNEPERGIDELRAVIELALRVGAVDDLFRAYANLTTALDLVGRREEAVVIANEGMAEAERLGLANVHGWFLAANAADSLFALGRWAEARAASITALEVRPTELGPLNPLLNLATVEIETNAGELAGRVLGRLLLELETVDDVQFTVLASQAAASYALWQDDIVEARRAAGRGWERVQKTEDWVQIVRMAQSVLEVAAAGVRSARSDAGSLATARDRARPVLALASAAVARSGVDETAGTRREVDALLATARAYQGRLDGRDDPAAWAAVADQWSAVGDPYRAAKARWRQAEAILGRHRGRAARAEARDPLVAAATAALSLGARPLLRAIAELAERALITLPPEIGERLAEGGASGWPPEPVAAESSELVRGFVGAGQPTRTNTFGLSAREREVLALIAEGLTNPEIGQRLFITRKTVGVHVSNILAKLGVSGRVEAAAVAIRLGLTERA